MNGLFQMGGQELDLLNTRRMQEELAKMNEQMNNLPTYQAPAPIVDRSVQSADLPPAPAQPKQNFLQRIGTKLQDPAYRAQLAAAFNTMRLNPDPSIAQRATDMRKEQKALQGANQTVAYLMSIGREDLANMVKNQPSLAPEVLKAVLAQQNKQETFGTSVHYYIDENGVPQAYQTSGLGGRRDLKFPEGATPVTSESEAAGKKFTALELQYLTEKEQDGKEGIDVMSRQLMALNDALADPDIMGAISSKVGVLQGRFPAVTSEQTLGESYIENFAAKSFMRAFQMLKGGGQITEREGAAAAAAIDRLQKFTLSDEDYKKAMEDARDELQDLIDIAESRQLVLGKKLAPYRARMNQMLGM